MKRKELIDKELSLYKEQEMLRIDKIIHTRKVNNWVILDKARIEANNERVTLAKLEAKREMLVEINDIKDKEIKMLKEIIFALIPKTVPRLTNKGVLIK